MHIAIHRTNVGMINWSIHLVISYFQPLFCLCFLPLLCDWNFLLHYLFRFPFHSVMCEVTKMISSICYWVRSISPLSCSTLFFFHFLLFNCILDLSVMALSKVDYIDNFYFHLIFFYVSFLDVILILKLPPLLTFPTTNVAFGGMVLTKSLWWMHNWPSFYFIFLYWCECSCIKYLYSIFPLFSFHNSWYLKFLL